MSLNHGRIPKNPVILWSMVDNEDSFRWLKARTSAVADPARIPSDVLFSSSPDSDGDSGMAPL